jgi:HK97 family phage major capsid protein
MTKKFNPKTIETKSSAISTEVLKKRGQDMKEKRTVTVSPDEILLPEHVSTKLSPIPFPVASRLADGLNIVNLAGGESYRKPYVKDYVIAGLSTEGQSYQGTTEPTVDYVDINRAKITALTEITEELEKLPAINYQAEVLKNINISIKKKLVQQVLHGSGGANQFVGIFSSSVKCLEESTPLEISDIDVDTLTNIIFHYGGYEEVKGKACLILNLADLYNFATLRTQMGVKSTKSILRFIASYDQQSPLASSPVDAWH